MEPTRPMWLPDTKGFLAIAIIVIFVMILAIITFGKFPENQTLGTLMTTMVGAVIVLMKDVYGYVFGSSASSSAKDETLSKMLPGNTTNGHSTPTP